MDAITADKIGHVFIQNGEAFCITSESEATHIFCGTTVLFSLGDEVQFLDHCFDINDDFEIQPNYQTFKADFYEIKYNDEAKKVKKMSKDIGSCIRDCLWDQLYSKFAGTQKKVFIQYTGKSGFESIQKLFSDKGICIIDDWQTSKVNTYSDYLCEKSIKLLLGTSKRAKKKIKYPLNTDGETLSLERVRFKYVHNVQHIKFKELRVECMVVSRNNG